MSRTEFFEGTETVEIIFPNEDKSGYFLPKGFSRQEIKLATKIAEKLSTSPQFIKKFLLMQNQTRIASKQALIDRTLTTEPKLISQSSLTLLVNEDVLLGDELLDLTTFDTNIQN
jgi:hypothetical protein